MLFPKPNFNHLNFTHFCACTQARTRTHTHTDSNPWQSLTKTAPPSLRLCCEGARLNAEISILCISGQEQTVLYWEDIEDLGNGRRPTGNCLSDSLPPSLSPPLSLQCTSPSLHCSLSFPPSVFLSLSHSATQYNCSLAHKGSLRVWGAVVSYHVVMLLKATSEVRQRGAETEFDSREICESSLGAEEGEPEGGWGRRALFTLAGFVLFSFFGPIKCAFAFYLHLFGLSLFI